MTKKFVLIFHTTSGGETVAPGVFDSENEAKAFAEDQLTREEWEYIETYQAVPIELKPWDGRA